MTTVSFSLIVVGLSIAASGQTTSAPDRTIMRAHEITRSADGTHLRGSVEIRLGTTVLYADEADITNGAPGEASEISLRGQGACPGRSQRQVGVAGWSQRAG